MNLYLKKVEPDVLAELDLYAWQSGLKTQYYTHSKSATKAKEKESLPAEVEEGLYCIMKEGCLARGS